MLIKIHKIHYSVDCLAYECLTKCPFRKDKFVGSLECKMCSSFINRSAQYQYILCGFPNEIIVDELKNQ